MKLNKIFLSLILLISLTNCSILNKKESIVYKPLYLNKEFIFNYCKKPITPYVYFNLKENSLVQTKDLIIYINYLYNNNILCFNSIESLIKIDEIDRNVK